MGKANLSVSNLLDNGCIQDGGSNSVLGICECPVRRINYRNIIFPTSFAEQNIRGTNMPSGWSAVGGQCQPAYVPTGVNPQDSTEGHSVRTHILGVRKPQR